MQSFTFKTAGCLLLLVGSARGQQFETATLKPFLAKHCAACHGAETHERGLQFDKLPVDFADKDSAATWDKVLARLSRGEMPPAEATQPSAAERRAITDGLWQRLHAASAAAQRQNGRVVLRRLNRVEYETTLRDLLGNFVSVKELLPDDNVAAGFDNVSAVLDVSSVHLLRYQDAAEKALQTVIPNRPQATIHERRTGREISEKQRFFGDLIGKTVRLNGDSLEFFAKPYGHIPTATSPTPQNGRYRVRASLRAINTGGQPIPVMGTCRDQYGRDDNDVRILRDIVEGESQQIEQEVEMRQRQMIVFSGLTLPSIREFDNQQKGKTLDDYAGPRLIVDWIEIEGPLDAWPPAGYTRLFGDVPLEPRSVAKVIAAGKPAPPPPAKRSDGWWIYDPLIPATANPREDAVRLLRAALPHFFRRPVDSELLNYYVKIVHSELEKEKSFGDAMLAGYKAALCSPHFLYLAEPRVETNEPRVGLDDFAIAARLSYFLWSSTPDRELLRLAARGELSQPGTLRAQTERLLYDPQGARFTQNFAGQWLELRQINATSPDPQIYGEFDDFLFWSMPRETELFFNEILRNDRSVLEFTHSNWTFLNQRLAKHYGIPDIQGGEMRRVTLSPESHRGGVLTHASVLKVTADGTKTSPVLRGKWVLEKIVGLPPAPPPPDVPAIEPDIRGATTIRQQLDKHRNTPACATCHKYIDPPGFALESFDVIGGWRDFYRGTRASSAGLVELTNYPGRRVYRGLDVEMGGQTPDGKPFKDIDDYKRYLLSDPDQLVRNVAQKLLVYATGADIQFADREVVEQLVARSKAKNHGLRSLVHEVVQSRVFLNK